MQRLFHETVREGSSSERSFALVFQCAASHGLFPCAFLQALLPRHSFAWTFPVHFFAGHFPISAFGTSGSFCHALFWAFSMGCSAVVFCALLCRGHLREMFRRSLNSALLHRSFFCALFCSGSLLRFLQGPFPCVVPEGVFPSVLSVKVLFQCGLC